MNLVYFTDKVLAILTVVSQVFIVIFVVYFLFFRKKYPQVIKYFSENGLLFSFIIALVATCGSLFYSNFAGFTPCELCWFQRVFMYPQVILLGVALYKKKKEITDYSLALLIVGLLISVYHNYIIFKGLHSVVCTISSPCTTNYVLEFGYITIPMMACTAFLASIILLFCVKYKG